MLQKLHRFHGYGSVRAVYGKGQTVRGGSISLKYSSRGPTKPYRVAVVVSRKVSKSAVVRNRIRRRVFEVVRLQAGSLQPGADLVFTVFDEQVATLAPDQLTVLVTSLLQKIT